MITECIKKIKAIRPANAAKQQLFTIDLLKGRGVPVRSGPRGIIVASAAAAVPIIIAIVTFGFYLSNTVAIGVQKQSIAGYETRLAKLADAVQLQKSLQQEKTAYENCLSEVAASIAEHTQWSPVLMTVIKNLPDSVVLTGLEVKQQNVRTRVASQDWKKAGIANATARTLRMSISGNPQSDCDKAVRDFRARLRASKFLGPMLQDIRVSQESGTLDGRDAVSYQIDCFFKPQL